MLNDTIINAAKCNFAYQEHPYKEKSNDRIRIAYKWLSAQDYSKNTDYVSSYRLKHTVERWAGCYISEHDVTIAGSLMHNVKVRTFDDLPKKYYVEFPKTTCTFPLHARLKNNPIAFTHVAWEEDMRLLDYTSGEGKDWENYLIQRFKERGQNAHYKMLELMLSLDLIEIKKGGGYYQLKQTIENQS